MMLTLLFSRVLRFSLLNTCILLLSVRLSLTFRQTLYCVLLLSVRLFTVSRTVLFSLISLFSLTVRQALLLLIYWFPLLFVRLSTVSSYFTVFSYFPSDALLFSLTLLFLTLIAASVP